MLIMFWESWLNSAANGFKNGTGEKKRKPYCCELCDRKVHAHEWYFVMIATKRALRRLNDFQIDSEDESGNWESWMEADAGIVETCKGILKCQSFKLIKKPNENKKNVHPSVHSAAMRCKDVLANQRSLRTRVKGLSLFLCKTLVILRNHCRIFVWNLGGGQKENYQSMKQRCPAEVWTIFELHPIPVRKHLGGDRSSCQPSQCEEKFFSFTKESEALFISRFSQ